MKLINLRTTFCEEFGPQIADRYGKFINSKLEDLINGYVCKETYHELKVAFFNYDLNRVVLEMVSGVE